MITVREAAEMIVTAQGGGDVDDVAHRLQQQIDEIHAASQETIRQASEVVGIWQQYFLPPLQKLVDAFAQLSRSIPPSYLSGKERRRRHIVNALNRTKEQSS